jgi:hypothetical protein
VLAGAAITVSFLAAGALARGGLQTAGGARASNPCVGLTGQIYTACEKAVAACNAAPVSARAVCRAQIDKAFGSLPRGSTTTRTTTTSTTSQGGGGGSTGSSTGGAPPPVEGKSADVAPVSGTVLVNGKPLTTGERIPFGATVDTTNGTVTLTSVSPTGTVQDAKFNGAVFKVYQPADKITTLVLTAGDFTVCSHKSTRSTASASGTSTVVRSLWGNGKGQFETRGRYAAATVRGTIWNTEDRCDGTFIRVKKGVVSVLDTVLNKTVVLTAGHTYLAKP